MPTPKPKLKELRRSYGFDEVAIVPGDVTINPDQTNIDFMVGDITFDLPIMAAIMVAVTDASLGKPPLARMAGLTIIM